MYKKENIPRLYTLLILDTMHEQKRAECYKTSFDMTLDVKK